MAGELLHFGADYSDRLSEDYGLQISREIVSWRSAELPHQPGQSIGYIRPGEGRAAPESRPVLFVPGFMAGIVADAPFGAEMTSRGFDIILPDQNRHGIMRNPDGKKDATYSQALNMAAIIEAEELANTPLDVVTASFGSLVLDSLHQIAQEHRWTCFEGAKAVLLAPAGIKQDESKRDFIKRYVATLQAGRHQQTEKFPDGFWEFESEMLQPALSSFAANPPRALREGYEIATRRVDTARLIREGLSNIALVLHAEDRLYSQVALEASLAELVTDRVTAFSPISLKDYHGRIRSGVGADHADHQFNPVRVAGAVEQFLRS